LILILCGLIEEIDGKFSNKIMRNKRNISGIIFTVFLLFLINSCSTTSVLNPDRSKMWDIKTVAKRYSEISNEKLTVSYERANDVARLRFRAVGFNEDELITQFDRKSPNIKEIFKNRLLKKLNSRNENGAFIFMKEHKVEYVYENYVTANASTVLDITKKKNTWDC
jgi:hypothetical protein